MSDALTAIGATTAAFSTPPADVTPLAPTAPLPDPFAAPPTAVAPTDILTDQFAGREMLDRSIGERLLERALAADVPFQPLLDRLDALSVPATPDAGLDPRLDALSQHQTELLAAQRDIAAHTTQTSLWLASTQMLLSATSKISQGINTLLKQQ